VVQRGIDELTRNARLAGAHTLVLEIAGNPDGSVVFSVTDDGGGVPHGMTHRIFEPFYQLDQTGEAVGTGLGLAILAAEVRALGGSLGIGTPEPGRTTVWFRIPAAGSMPQEVATYPGTASPGRHRPAAREICDRGDRAPRPTSGRAPASGSAA
jgi:signal transduction histidine kinase